MLQLYLVRHGETEWNVARRIQGQSDSPLTEVSIRQAKLVAERVKSIGVTHIVSSDLGCIQKTAEMIAQACHCNIILGPRLRELNMGVMGVLEGRAISSLSDEEERWRRSLVDGSFGARIPNGESMGEIAKRMFTVLEMCRSLPAGSIPLLVSHGIGVRCTF